MKIIYLACIIFLSLAFGAKGQNIKPSPKPPEVDTSAMVVISLKDFNAFFSKQIGRPILNEKGEMVNWEKGDLMKAFSQNQGISNDTYEKIDAAIAQVLNRIRVMYDAAWVKLRERK